MLMNWVSLSFTDKFIRFGGIMFKNYLKVAARNLLKQKSYSFINILGLAVGIAASVLISLYVLDELSYDKFHDKADRTYRIAADWSNKGDSKIHQLGTPAVLSKTLRDKYPQVETVTQINGPILDCTLKAGEKALKEAEAYLAEPSFFQVFSFTMLEGDPMTSLRDPNTVVLAQSVAAKLFGAENPMGRKIQLYAGGSPELLRVTGVVRDVPTNSPFRFGLLVAMALGLLKGHYGSNNSGEYWCEGTQFWFWSNFEYKDGDKKIYSPAELRSYDPGLYELLSRVYPTSHHIPMDPFWNHKERYKPMDKAPEGKKIPN